MVPFGRVRELVLAARPNEFNGAAQVLLGLNGAATPLKLSTDPARLMIAVQGQFWYRGEYSYVEHPDGTLLRYEIHNVSSFPDPVIKLWQRATLREIQPAANKLAQNLTARLS